MNMLDYMNTEGFRFDINIENFFHRLYSLLIYEKSIGIKIEDLLYLIEEKIVEKQKIEEEINKLYDVYGVTKKQLQEYKNNKTLFENFINLQNIYTITMGKNVIKNEFDYDNVLYVRSIIY